MMVGALVMQQGQRIGMETRHQIQFDFRPVIPECVHRRHQPLKAGVAFHRDAQLSCPSLDDPGDIAFRLIHQCHGALRQHIQALPRLGQAQRLGFSLK